MKKLFALLWMPFMAFGSVVYNFSEVIVGRGTTGFTYTAPTYLTQSTVYIDSNSFTSCDTSGLPGWVCTGVYLRQYTSPIPGVQVSFNLLYPAGAGDAFSTDQINESFSNASLTSDGVYDAFQSRATLTISSTQDTSNPTAVPEPGTGVFLAFTGSLLLCARFHKRAKPKTD